MSVHPVLSIRRKLGLLILLASALAMSAVAAAAVSYEATSFRPRAAQQLRVQAAILAEILGPSMDFGDAQTAERYLKVFRASQADAAAAAVYDTSGQLFASDRDADVASDLPATGIPSAAEFAGNSLALWQPIERNGTILGFLYLREQLPPLHVRLLQYGIMAGGVLLALAVVGPVLLGGVRRQLVGPLSALVEATERIAREEDYGIRVPVAGADELCRLAESFNHMIEVVGRRETALRESDEQVRRSEEKFSRAFLASPTPLIITRLSDSRILDLNAACERLFAKRRADVVGQTSFEVGIWPSCDAREPLIARLQRDGHLHAEHATLRFDGALRPCLVWAEAITISDEACVLVMVEDLTEREAAEAERIRLEGQLQQAQKLEAVGRLAGGVAHDFNNMLTVILGQVEIALTRLAPSDRLHGNLAQIQRAAEHSAELTRQLLAFARRQTVVPKVLDLNDAVGGMHGVLRRLIGEDIELAWQPGEDIWRVKIDPAQVHQILANLCVNARDAIDGVGHVRIETGNVTFDPSYCAERPDHLPGSFAVLSVRDTGRGIDAGALPHIFEPFFTTKGTGEGTGLGLATVFGVVKQNDGFITVDSAPGLGATFRIHLPRYAGDAAEQPAASFATMPRGAGETLLLVEDEPAILELGRDMLEDLGYSVVTAGSPGAAIEAAAARPDISLLITDVVMPDMTGRDLADRLRALRPALPCLFVSGYTANVIEHRGVVEEGLQFLAKPFSMTQLALKVRETLDAKASQPVA